MSSKSSTNSYVFFTALWTLNPNNYIIAVSFLLLIIIYNIKIKNLKLSLLLTYLASSVILTGKSYPIQLVPKGILPLEIYPFGYFVRFTITPSSILAVLMFLIILRDLINSRINHTKLTPFEILLIIYFLWTVVADYFGSGIPEFSVLFSILSLTIPILYFYIKLYVKQKNTFIKIIIYLLSAIVIFESLIATQQFLAKSPIGKTLEYQQGIEHFGNTVDEIQFTFRPVGTFGHANEFGIWMSSYLIIIILYSLIKQNYILSIASVMGIVALVTTLSRSAWMGFLIGILLSLFILEKLKKIDVSKKIKKYLPWLIFLGVPLFFFFIFPRLEKSFYTFSQGGGYFRKIQIQRAAELIKKNYIFGVGSFRSVPEGLKITSVKDPNFSILSDVHNWYISSVVEHGIPSVLLFLPILYLYFNKLFSNKNISMIKLGLAAGVISTLMSALFQPYINLQIIILALAFI